MWLPRKAKLKLLFRTRTRNTGSVAGLVVLIVCLASFVLVIFNRQQIIDQIAVWQYKPTQKIENIADQAGMSGLGKFYFFASKPSIEATQVFNSECERKEEKSAILGCYSNRQIYIFDVQDSRLEGVEEVTAAHEMLHAVWDRLSEGERKKLEPLLESAYAKVEDAKLVDRMEYYSRAQPGERSNELHSIVGTENIDLGKELEAHYSKYFDNRAMLVKLYNDYRNIFDEIETKSNDLAAKLKLVSGDIEKLSQEYNIDVKVLNSDIETFNQRAAAGGFASNQAFQAERSDLIARTEKLSSNRDLVNLKIAEYEKLRKELQSINAESKVLNDSLDSTLAPAPNL